MVRLQSIEGSNSLKNVKIRGSFCLENCVEIEKSTIKPG